MKIKTLIISLASFLLILNISFAAIGVGVGSGKMNINDDLRPGGIYNLPVLPVLNTGDVESDYAISVEFNASQTQIRPDASWFTFTPQNFRLSPGKSQPVRISISIPLKAIPGEYFAYIEAHPVMEKKPGSSRIGIAAASKLYFTIAPANFFQGLYYRTISLFEQNAPWSYVTLGIIVLIILFLLLKKYLKFNFSVGLKK